MRFQAQEDGFEEQLRHINMKRFRGELVLKAYILLHHSTLGSRVIKKRKQDG